MRLADLCVGCDSSDDADAGEEWVRVTETELEGPDDAGGLARRIQLIIALSSRDVTLTLERNDHVPASVPVVVGHDGRLQRISAAAASDADDRVRLKTSPV